MQLPYEEELNIQYLSRVFDNKSECYKLFWFQAIVTKILEGQNEVTFEELVDEMIADAWYMVSEYHLNLGPKDNLEAVVRYIYETEHMKSSEQKNVILDYLRNCNDKNVIRFKHILTGNVPYRLQAPFMIDIKGKAWEGSKENLIIRINLHNRLIYYFGKFNGLNTSIHIQPEWISYIQRNRDIIKGWLQYNMITYLQKRNPSVPGIADKLYPPQTRKLERVKKYWRMIMEVQPIYEIYSRSEVTVQNVSIDHFVPWSYVAHDELWNLHPTTKSINSSKSNYLPDWERYFPLLCDQEYLSYTMLWQNTKIYDEFEKCAKEHLNNDEIRRRLYRKGLEREEFGKNLSEVLEPVYKSAKNCGFGNWVYQKVTRE